MKKNIRLIVALALIVAMCMLGPPNVSDAWEKGTISQYEQSMDMINEEIMESTTVERRGREAASIIQASKVLSKCGNEDWYSGQYIDGNGRLHVLTTDIPAAMDSVPAVSVLSNSEIYSLNNNTIVQSPDVIIEKRAYSLDALQKAMAEIISFNNMPEIFGVGIDEEKNCVIVELSECDDETIDEFRTQIMDSPIIIFVQAKGMPIPQATIYAGSCVYPTSGSRVTITTFAYKGNDFGFVTVGHTLGNTIRTSSSGTILGTTQNNNKIISATADASWTKLNSGHTGVDGTAKVGSTIMNYGYFDSSYSPVQGASVAVFLGRSNTVRYSTIAQLNYYYICGYNNINSEWQNIYCYDMRVTNTNSQSGDSGSPMFATAFQDAGNVIWGALRSGNGTDSYFCNIRNNITALGLEHLGG